MHGISVFFVFSFLLRFKSNAGWDRTRRSREIAAGEVKWEIDHIEEYRQREFGPGICEVAVCILDIKKRDLWSKTLGFC